MVDRIYSYFWVLDLLYPQKECLLCYSQIKNAKGLFQHDLLLKYVLVYAPNLNLNAPDL